MMEMNFKPSDMTYIEHLNQPIDIDEIRQTLITGKRPKATGSYGLGREFTKFIGQQ
jgi:hypothetical protein